MITVIGSKLRCSPTGFDFGSGRGECDGWFDEPTVHFIDLKSFIGCGACGYVGEGESANAIGGDNIKQLISCMF
jgi:hypothetical protein